jgi:hypothetical protein
LFYLWTMANVHPLSFSFDVFLARFSLSIYVFPLYTPSVLSNALRF